MRTLYQTSICVAWLVSGCSSPAKPAPCAPTTGASSVTMNRHGNASVFTQIVTMTLKPEHEQEFLETAAKYAAFVHENEPKTLLYVLTKDPEEPHSYVWVERYADEAASEGDTPEFKEAVDKVTPWLAKPPVIKKLTQVFPK